jgi:hypothetical protein
MYPSVGDHPAVDSQAVDGRWTLPAELTSLGDDTLVGLVDACARARAGLDAAEARVVAELDRRGLASRAGAVDAAAWLAARTGIGEGVARNRVRLAATLEQVPAAAAALAAGSITADHVHAVGRAVNEVGAETVADAQDLLVGWARERPVGRFARRLRRWVLTQHRNAGRDTDDINQTRRTASLSRDPVTGAGRLIAELPVEGHTIVSDTLWALVREQWRTDHHDRPLPTDDPTIDQCLADALVEMARRAAGATVNSRNNARPLMLVVIDHATLTNQLDAHGLGRLADGTPVPATMLRRLACDADLLPVVLAGDSQPLDVGRRQRLATPAQRAAMHTRSATCEWPGCTIPAPWCDAHHLQPWNAQGRTDLDNLAWMCTQHHHHAHTGNWHITRNVDGTLHVTPANQPDQRDQPEPEQADQPHAPDRPRRPDRPDRAPPTPGPRPSPTNPQLEPAYQSRAA